MPSFKFYEQFFKKKKSIIYENPEHHNNWHSSPGNKATSKTLYRLHIAQYTKSFSGLSIMVHLAQMKLPHIQRHLWLWFQFSILIPVNFHKAVILASWIQKRQAVLFFFFANTTKSSKKSELPQIHTSRYPGFTIQPRRIQILYIMKPQTHKIHLGTEFETRANHSFSLPAILNQDVYFVKYLPIKK